MPAPTYSSAQIKAFAREQLQTSEVPLIYLTQLREHLVIFPYDHLFRLHRFAGVLKYGAIECLEPGCCASQISLYPRESVADGGRSLGIGGLTAFQSHIRDSPIHVALRNARVEKKHNANSSISKTSSSRQGFRGPAEEKKPNVVSSSKRSSSVIEEDDDSACNKKSKKQHLPIMIDSDSDSDVMVASQPAPAAAVSPEVVDYVWLDGEGLVPMTRFLAQSSITESKPFAPSSSQRTFSSSATPTANRPNLPTQAELSSQLREASAAHAHHSSDLRIALQSSDYARVRTLRPKVAQDLNLIRLLKKQIEEAPDSQDFPNASSSAVIKPNVYSTDTKLNLTASTSRARMRSITNSRASTPAHPGALQRELIPSGSRSRLSMSLASRDSVPPYMRSPSHDSPDDHEQDAINYADVWAGRHLAERVEALRIMSDAERDEFYKKAIINSDFETNVTVAQARKDLGIPEVGDAYMPGMSTPLYPHQMIGISWMIGQERSGHKGGMLADSMGLGKTIEMIATMTANPPTEPCQKTTLIIAPLALTVQWKKEIERKSTVQFKILLYYGNSRPSKKVLKTHDIVITTYGVVNAEWADDKAALKAFADSSLTPPCRSKSGTLFDVDFYRIVLDESQTIRNPNSKISRAVYQLQSHLRWSLTGTPIFNRLLDIFPQLRFLRIRPYNDIQEFRARVAKFEKKRPNLAGQRAQAILKTFMLRRQKTSKLDGKVLVPLPNKNIEQIMLDMGPEEREIYDAIQSKMQVRFNRYLRAGTVLKNYAHILVMLLRLRQACGHPSLCTEASDEAQIAEPRDDPAQELKRATSNMGQGWVKKVIQKCQEELDELAEAEKDDPTATVPECPICSEALDDTARVTKCMHTFCTDCIDQVMNHDDHADAVHDRLQDPDKVEKPCPNCRAPFKRPDTYLRQAFMPEKPVVDDDGESDDEGDPRVAYRSRRNVIDDSDDELPDASCLSSKAKGKEKAAPKYALEPSTKMVWLLEELKTIHQESPTDKLLIISQWVSLLDIVAGCLEANGYCFVRYQGDMKPHERTEAVDKFEDEDRIPIMLMSLKCGGVGLNLTRGNRVVSLDLAWSPATEAQAFDRVHRLGQTKEVFVKRIMINNTVEQRMCELQDKKKAITDNALGEGSGNKLSRLTVAQLANLFNLDAHGNELA